MRGGSQWTLAIQRFEVSRVGAVVTIVILLMCALASTVAGAWLMRRHRQMLVWNKELDAAFATDRSRELPRPRAL